VHLVGFNTQIYQDARSHERQISVTCFTPFPKHNAARIFSLLPYFMLLKTDVSTILCVTLRWSSGQVSEQYACNCSYANILFILLAV